MPANCPALSDDGYVLPSHMRFVEAFEESRWFTRGWTLQELIAPQTVLFFGCCWNFIGRLADLVQRVSGITNIPLDVLDHTRPLSDVSVARRLSWAAKRKTTRKEDEAYSLFGIMDVNMPLLYGEGGSKAFLRLQDAIIHQSTDQSIFAWDAPPGFVESRERLLAPSPRCFMNCGKIRRRRGTASESSFTITNKGLEITLPIVRRRLYEDPACPYATLGILDCKYEGSADVLALVMSQHPFNVQGGTPALELYISGFERPIGSASRNVLQYARLIPVSPVELAEAEPKLLTITKDLQSQTYIQALNTNDTSWFPVRFTGNEISPPTLRDIWPEHCWSEGTKTMRLRAPYNTCGGIVVDTKDGKLVLIIFGVHTPTGKPPATTRKVYGLVFIDPEFTIEFHLKSLMCDRSQGEGETAGLRINRHERIVARLWRGALTVSVENAVDEQAIVPSSPTFLSPPSSPQSSMRRSSFSASRRRDSLLEDGRSERSSSSHSEAQQAVHYTSRCEHCRTVRAKEKAENDRRREEQARREAAREAERSKAEKYRKRKTQATQAGIGLSLGSVLMEFADEAAVFLA